MLAPHARRRSRHFFNVMLSEETQPVQIEFPVEAAHCQPEPDGAFHIVQFYIFHLETPEQSFRFDGGFRVRNGAPLFHQMFRLNGHDLRAEKSFDFGTVEFEVVHSPENMSDKAVGAFLQTFRRTAGGSQPGDAAIGGGIADFSDHRVIVKFHFAETAGKLSHGNQGAVAHGGDIIVIRVDVISRLGAEENDLRVCLYLIDCVHGDEVRQIGACDHDQHINLRVAESGTCRFRTVQRIDHARINHFAFRQRSGKKSGCFIQILRYLPFQGGIHAPVFKISQSQHPDGQRAVFGGV